MNLSNSTAVGAALVIGWAIFMVYHGDLPGFLWVLGAGGAQPPFCTESASGAQGASFGLSGQGSTATVGGITVPIIIPAGSGTGPV